MLYCIDCGTKHISLLRALECKLNTKNESKMNALKKESKSLTSQRGNDYSKGMETGHIQVSHRFFTVDHCFLSKYLIDPKN